MRSHEQQLCNFVSFKVNPVAALRFTAFICHVLLSAEKIVRTFSRVSSDYTDLTRTITGNCTVIAAFATVVDVILAKHAACYSEFSVSHGNAITLLGKTHRCSYG